MARTLGRRLVRLFAIVLLTLSVSSCDLIKLEDDDFDGVGFDLHQGWLGWDAIFTNFEAEREEEYELTVSHRQLPAPLDTRYRGIYVSGKNLSAELNMFLVRRIDGLLPNTNYDVAFNLVFASDAPHGCVGEGGAPGESVTVHAAADGLEPRATEVDGYYVLNSVTRFQGDWYAASRVGDVATTRSCEQGPQYEIKTIETREDHWRVRSDAIGRIWLLVGTRSGFESTTSLYYAYIGVIFRER